MSVSTAARGLKISKQRVGHLCRRHKIGAILGRTRVLTETDYERLKTCRRPYRRGESQADVGA